jgi:hypothetical protein
VETLASLALLAGLVLGVIGYARRSRPNPPRREVAPTLIPADSTDFQPSTIAAPVGRRDRREFDDSE